MSDPGLVATYRLQLRGGVGLDAARALLPRLVALGISHLYLSPPFAAASGSTHGYDVIDPRAIDPVLGGEAAFVALADAARNAGIGLVLDIVPNHMAFTPENPFVADIMRHGRASRFAGVFDIDWDKGPLHFPVLDGTAEDLLAAGQIGAGGTAQSPVLTIYGQPYPLRDTPLAREVAEAGGLDAPTLSELLAQQWWSVGDWRGTADAIVHRRFFNITGLIGVRQEDPAVFDLTHRWIVEHVRAGRIQGLRVDHIDGLARPGAYLRRLREAVGEVPVWIEKIVKQGEAIPASWPIEGMSGYEFMTPVTGLLTHAPGLAAMREAALGAVPDDVPAEVRAVRAQLLAGTLAPELRRVTGAAGEALAVPPDRRGPLGEGIRDLACVWPVYRAYTADGCPLDPALDALRGVSGQAGALLDLLHAAADDEPARIFAARFEQLTGALTAKSEEDTVFFRSVAYLPFCEVGAEPELDAIETGAFEALMQRRAKSTPFALNALSTHDTKRSADARAALIALSHFPEPARRFCEEARRRAAAAGLPERWGLYALQTALALWGEAEAQDRIAAHIAKAMREAKDISTHEDPDEQAEARGAALCCALHAALDDPGFWPGDIQARYQAARARTVLAQAAFQLTAPGIPDIYQGTQRFTPALTDPDNRRPIDWSEGRDDLSARKEALTRDLLEARRADPALFARGSYSLVESAGGWRVTRECEGRTFSLQIARPLAGKQG
ncbi:malto-oligosyltrehalose synthase [Novosphingobium sp. TCA1]|uniref:malto-oligosyltrehalose synthase n=1 Tax=Novosphingobium sp. TCA1 TaxID=2682474 RepID=UPI00130C44B6|nr:malto-oligosyltrehalose synthase [Novosphingobium sp. TCA1]GFE74923.1 malto-oligosyltrehalose synthase [Novosphingobium sp. TCA1]